MRGVLGGLVALVALLVVFVLAIPLTMMDEAEQGGTAGWSELALKEIAPSTRLAYERAAEAYGLDGPYILAGLHRVESAHGTSTKPGVKSGVNEYGCCAGPAQFMISRNAGCRTSCYADPSKGTWEAYGVDGDGDGVLNVYDIDDAAMSAANYLSANGAPKSWTKALLVYNHSTEYGVEVMEWGAKYRGTSNGSLTLSNGMTRGQVASHPNLSFQNSCARAEIPNGTTEDRLVVVLGSILSAGHSVLLYAMACDHSAGTNHEAGRAADIAIVDGKVCNYYTREDACGKLLIALSKIDGPYKPTELIGYWDPNPADPANWASPSDHYHHIHLGFKPK